LIYTLDETDDVFDPKVWIKANPNFGVSVDPINFEAKARKAQENPQDLANFKIKHLNLWVSEADAFFDMEKWDACCDPTLKIEDYFGQKCNTGIDLASKVDLTSLGTVFKKEDKYVLFTKNYMPEEAIERSKNSLFPECVGKGFLVSTTGQAINYPKIQSDLLESTKSYKADSYLFDPWNCTEFSQRMAKEGLNMVEFRMNTSNVSEPLKMFDAMMRMGKIVHDGNPLLRWCIGNVVVKPDANDNIYFRKSHEKLKIDHVVSLIMAFAAWIKPGEDKTSVYETRGIRTL